MLKKFSPFTKKIVKLCFNLVAYLFPVLSFVSLSAFEMHFQTIYPDTCIEEMTRVIDKPTTTTIQKNEFDICIENLRNATLEYYQSNPYDGKIVLVTTTYPKLSLSPGFNFQLAITCLYDGSNYYEGLSEACEISEKYSLTKSKWKEMSENSIKMARLSKDLALN